jgi:hypothetical protein
MGKQPKELTMNKRKSTIAFDHTADKISDAIPGGDHDVSRELFMDLMKDPHKVFGSKKSEIAEWLHQNSDDPNVLMAVSMILIEGIGALRAMSELQHGAEEAMKTMEIKEDMPEEMKAEIRRLQGEEPVAQTEEDTMDAFEALKAKYSQG